MSLQNHRTTQDTKNIIMYFYVLYRNLFLHTGNWNVKYIILYNCNKNHEIVVYKSNKYVQDFHAKNY